MHEELINAPLATALERFQERDVFLHVLAPPHAAVGVGSLHVVRVHEEGNRVELTVTYDDFEKVPEPRPRSAGAA